MGLLDFLSGGGNGATSDLYAGALTPEQQAALRQRSLGGAMAGLLKSGALDYTVPFISGKVPGGVAAGLAGAAAGAQDAQDQAANTGLKAQEFVLNRNILQQKLGMLQQLINGGGLGEFPEGQTGPSGGATPPEMGGQGAPESGAALAPIGQGPGEGHVAPRADRVAYITQGAVARGLNPMAVLATVQGEGLNKYTGDNGTSFGDFQLHVGGGSMGDQALAAGINIRDPKTWQQQTDFALDQMAAHKGNADWYAGQWHGAPDWAANTFAQGRRPVQLAQNGPLTSLPAGTPPGGPGMQGIPGAGISPPAAAQPAPGAPLGVTPNLGIPIRGPMSMPGQPAAPMPSPGASPVPQLPNGPTAPPPAMPQGLLPPSAINAPANPGIPPIAQPQPPPPAAPPGPASAGIPSSVLTPAQRAYAANAQRQALAYSLLGIKPPAFLEGASQLPFAQSQAAAKAWGAAPANVWEAHNKPQVIRQGGSLWESNPATGQYELKAQSPRLPEGTSLTNTPQGPIAQEVPGAIPAIQSASQAQHAGKYQAEFGGVPGFQPGAPVGGQLPASATETAITPTATPQGTLLPPIGQQFMPQSPAEIQEALPKWHAQTEKWTEAIAPARQAEMRLASIANAFKLTESGAWETHKAELAGLLKELSIDPGLVMATKPDQVQIALHDNMLTTLPLLKAATPRPSQIEFLSVSENREHPNIQPAANLHMLSEDLALVRQAQQLPADWNVAQQQGWRNPQSFETAWSQLNPLPKTREQIEKEIGPLKGMPGGPGSPPPPSGAVKALQMNPMLRDQFDAKYGAGSSAKALGR